MKRWLAVLLAIVVAGVAVTLVVYKRQVQVETGTRYVCTYGESLGSDVRLVKVPESEAAKYTVTTKRVTCAKHKEAEELYLRAQERITKGDLKGAKTDLTAIVAIDPKFKQAASQLSLIASGKKPKPDGTSGGDTTPPPADDGSTPATKTDDTSPAMDSYRWLVPDSITGFTAEGISAEALSLTRAYIPSQKTRYDQLVVMVQQCGSETSSKSFVDGTIKPAYPEGKKVTASGLSGWFGVNGSRFAALSLVRGPVVVTFELHATGAKPASLEQDLGSIAANLLR